MWLYSYARGAWFIPYTELDDYCKSHPPDPAGAPPPGGHGADAAAKAAPAKP